MSIKITLFGAKSTGKTTYIGALGSSKNEGKLIVKDEAVKKYVFDIVRLIEKNIYPEATSGGIKTVEFHYNDNTKIYKKADFILNDYDGKYSENLQVESENKNQEKLTDFISSSKGIIFLIPYYTKEDIEAKNDTLAKIRFEIGSIVTLMENDKNFTKKPAVIAISMWDKVSEDTSDIDYAKRYIEENEQINGVYDVIIQHFDLIGIVPFSSQERDNILAPIEMILARVFSVWTDYIYEECKKIDSDIPENEKIETKAELKKFINTRRQDLKFYDDGKLLKECGKKIGDPFFERLKFHKKTILIFVFIIFAVLLLIFKLSIGQTQKEETNIYNQIVSEAKNHRYKVLVGDIKLYREKFKNVNTVHYKKIIEIESSMYKECKNYITKQMEAGYGIHNLQKLQDKMIDISNASKICTSKPLREKIDARSREISYLDNLYTDAQNILNDFDVKEIDEKELVQTARAIGELDNYEEGEKLQRKYITVIENIASSGNESAIETILERTSTLKIPDGIRAKLQKSLRKIHNEQNYAEILDDIQALDFEQTAKFIITTDVNFTAAQRDNLKSVLNNKFNITIENILKNKTPDAVRNIDDFTRLKKAIQDISIAKENAKIETLSYEPSVNISNSAIVAQKRKMLETTKDILSNGSKPRHIAFSAYNENNMLNFSCGGINSNDDLRLDIDGYKYDEEGATCINTKITYTNKHRYRPGTYYAKATEWDPVSNDVYTFSFRLSNNDILLMANGKVIKKNIGQNYGLEFIP